MESKSDRNEETRKRRLEHAAVRREVFKLRKQISEQQVEEDNNIENEYSGKVVLAF